MPRVPDKIEMMDERVARIMRRKSIAERLAMGLDMWSYARRRIDAAVRWQHPDWDDNAVTQEVRRRMGGAI